MPVTMLSTYEAHHRSPAVVLFHISQFYRLTCPSIVSLRRQLHVAIAHSVPLSELGLSAGARLLSSLRCRVVELASGSGVLPSVQAAAQGALKVGWSALLPTAEERAKTLSTLLPHAGGSNGAERKKSV